MFGEVREPFWDDSSVIIIGGGPSLRGFDFTRLAGLGRVLAVNEAACLIPSDAVFSLDRNWIRRKRGFLASYPGERYFAVPPDWRLEHCIPGAIYLAQHIASHHEPLSLSPAAIATGGNSGFGALNLAFLKRAKDIFLLGFDFRASRVVSHWHDSYGFQTTGNHYGKWAVHFAEAKDTLDKAGVRVYNGNADSGIRCFPFRTI